VRLGGIAALAIAAGYLATMPLFSAVGAPPVGAEARLAYHAAAGPTWWGIIGLSVATDLLFVPLALSLYAALRPAHETGMRLATTFTLLFVVLDLAVTWPAYASLAGLGEAYAAAPEGARAALVAAAGYPASVLDSPLQAVNSILTLSVGILATGLVTLRASAGRTAGVLGVATGAAGITSVAHTIVTGEVSPLAIAATLFTIAWLVATGRLMLREHALLRA
jgi:hypothetical protein